MKKKFLCLAILLLFAFVSLASCTSTASIEISEDGYWVINGEKTEYLAQGAAGVNGNDGLDGTDGKDGLDGTDGKDGLDGTDGKDGLDGTDGKTPYIKDGYWYIDDVNTGVKAEGTDGKNAPVIKTIEYDSNGMVTITFDDGNQYIIFITENQKHTHIYSEWFWYEYYNADLYYRVCYDCNLLEWRNGAPGVYTIFYGVGTTTGEGDDPFTSEFLFNLESLTERTDRKCHFKVPVSVEYVYFAAPRELCIDGNGNSITRFIISGLDQTGGFLDPKSVFIDSIEYYVYRSRNMLIWDDMEVYIE